MPEILNIKEAKELVVQYRSITIEQLEETYQNVETDYNYHYDGETTFNFIYQSLRSITGFGNWKSCSLCRSIMNQKPHLYGYESNKCQYCVHSISDDWDEVGNSMPCINGNYDEIAECDDLLELLHLIWVRANYIESLINKYEGSKI